MNPFDAAVEIVGGTTEFARAIGVSPQVVCNWRKRGVPPERCLAVEAATKGAVTRYELRPDVFGPAPESSDAA